MKNIFLTTILSFAVSFAGGGPVSYYGELKVRPNTPFIDGAKTGARAQIRGVSFGWSNTDWESERFYNANAVERMAKDWKAEVVRAAYGATSRVFTDTDAIANRNRIETIVDAAIEQDVFVIIDWHSHSAQNEIRQAKDFFAYMAEKYGEYDNVIFELYNEPYCKTYRTITNPDGSTVTTCQEITPWEDIKTYSEEIIPVIREHSDNLILVGTPNYSQRVEDVIGKKLRDPNLGYVLHFYAASHNVELWRDNMNAAINDTMPLFITEYGTTHSDGGCDPVSSYRESDCRVSHYNTHNTERSEAWHIYMDSRKISSVAWNINDKYEGSAFFGSVPVLGGKTFDQSVPENWADTTKMTASGKYIFKKLNEYYQCAPWNPESDPSCGGVPVRFSAAFSPEAGAVIEVFSMQGKKIGELPGDYRNTKALNLKNGVYILLLRQNGAVQTKILRIVK